MSLYENAVILKGFLGNDGQSQSTRNDKAFVVLSLATKSSYKDKQSEQWISRTEWHRVVCFGKPAEQAKRFKKGDYVEVRGELRSSEFSTAAAQDNDAPMKRRFWEIRALGVCKLIRTDNPAAEPVPEGNAA